MERNQLLRYRVAIVGLIVVIVSMLTGFAVASAVVSNSDGTVNVCYLSKNGHLRVATKDCTTKETPITLSGSTPLFAVVQRNGTVDAQKHVISVDHGAVGYFGGTAHDGYDLVTFDRAVTNCAVTATVNDANDGIVASAIPGITGPGLGPTTVLVVTGPSTSTFSWRRYSLQVEC